MNQSNLAKRLTIYHRNIQELQDYPPDLSRAVRALHEISGDLRPEVAYVFPEDRAVHFLQAKTSRRQIWWATLSGLNIAAVSNAENLYLSLMLLSDDALLHARFGAKADQLRPILKVLSPKPLGKGQYDVLAALVEEEAENMREWIARDGYIDTTKLRNYLFKDIETMREVLLDEYDA